MSMSISQEGTNPYKFGDEELDDAKIEAYFISDVTIDSHFMSISTPLVHPNK